MKQLVLYLHGRGGTPAEADHYKPLFPQSDVIGFDYQAQTPQEADTEFSCLFDRYSTGYDSVILIANSIGAFFALHALSEKPITQALFISPVVDMEQMILNLMEQAHVTEADLRRMGEVPADFGETLSWETLCYVREHPITWQIPSCILYGETDFLTAKPTMEAFAQCIHAPLTVMPCGEHWFHTPEQMTFLDAWVKASIC